MSIRLISVLLIKLTDYCGEIDKTGERMIRGLIYGACQALKIGDNML